MKLVPAYGRAYKSKAAIIADLEAGKDFTIADMSSPWDGSYINLEQIQSHGGIKEVTVRYKQLRSVTVINITKLQVKK